MRLLDNVQFLFTRVLTTRPSAPSQRIDFDVLGCGGVHSYVDTYDVPAWHIIGIANSEGYAATAARLR